MKQIFTIIMASCMLVMGAHSSQLFAQGEESATIQPTIMVIPYVKKGEDIRRILEDDICRRVAIAKVKEGFDLRGFTTVDFMARLRAAEIDDAFTGADLNDLKSILVEASNADIYVEVEAFMQTSEQGNSARLVLNAYDAFTSRSLATKTNSSMVSRASDSTLLVENALSRRVKDPNTGRYIQYELVQDMLNIMQEKFTDMVENGRPVKVMFTLKEDAAFDFDSETMNGELFSDEIDFWMEDHAYKANYSDPRISGNRVTIEEVRIPLKTEKGRNYRPSRFAREIYKFIKSVQLEDLMGDEIQIDRDIRGGTLYFSLQ
ncbi:DUF6175 family protein [Pontibacter sp. G13]|uniref:DUF6175 family protein n=1 Tax=Pontibacter sp. G13 TaxID=3074898 RepID=UPI00288A7452|nr:DUF6175 family protein [Pontibacter sp. G13]WNJ17553.1 DUF6175 family protein [Pontibacter sp. G13]